MIQLADNEKKGYCQHTVEDPLKLKEGYCHFNQTGQKDFLNKMIAYEPGCSKITFELQTFRKKQAEVVVEFISQTAFRFRMYPEAGKTYCENSVLPKTDTIPMTIKEEEEEITASTERLMLRFQKCPWQMSVYLDGEELTKEQIKDQDVGQKYKSVPTGFSVDENGRVTDTFETMYMYSDEAFYGFGEKFTDFNKRGQKICVWQRDAQSTNSDISYKGMPYFVSTQGYSILVNTFTRTHFNMGASSGVSYTMETEDPYLDYYLFANRNMKGLLADYTEASGRSPMIPRWAFGFWMSKMSYLNRAEVEEIAEKMNEFGMSADVIHIDAWMDMFGNASELLSFDEKRFPKPEEMIAELRKKGFHLSLWMFPYVQTKITADGTQRVSRQYLSMKERGFLVKRTDGEPYIFSPGEGDTAGWGVAALDFTNPEFVLYMKERVKRLMKMGVGVIKTDFSEEVPEDAVFWDGSTGKEAHNKYTLLYARTIYEASVEAKEELGESALLWGRSGYSGSQNYPANWAGDSSAAKNNLAAVLNGGLSMGMSGVSFWGFDIGGFYNCDYEGRRCIPSDDEYIRSVQMGLMSPLSRSHGQSTPREPWVFSRETQKAFLKINKLRYRLLPYLYSTAYETHYKGLPMMRAMVLEFQEDRNVRNLSRQYMLGESLLVAPVFDQEIVKVYLPKGSWIDFYTGERLEGGKWITAEKRLDQILLYLRENHMIPMLQEAPMHIENRNFEKLVVILNLQGELEAHYYDDGICGKLFAKLVNETLIIESEEMKIELFEVYSEKEICNCVVNKNAWKLKKTEHGFIATRG